MNEIEKILLKKPEDRTDEDLKYLEEHQDELTPDQKTQLEKELAIDDIVEETIDLESPLQKDLGHTVRKEFPTEVKDLGEGIIEAIVASESLDRHGEIIDMKGMDIKKYMSNPIVAWGHNYDEPSIGKTLKLTKTRDGKLVAKMEFAINEYEKAKTIYNLYKGGFMKAFSIGFIPEEVEGNRYTKSQMIEYSAVLVPANPDALMLAKKKGIDTTNLLAYTPVTMYELKEVLKKEVQDLTVGEIKFLKENITKLSGEDKTKFAEVLEEKDVVAEMKTAISEAVNPLKDEIEALKNADPVTVKNINNGDPEKTEAKNFNHNKKEKEITKEQNFQYYVRALVHGDMREYENAVGKDAMNTTDTGVVLPPQEFVTDIIRLEEQYGVARRFATVRRSDRGAGINFLMGGDDVEIFDTAEAGVKRSTKLSYTNQVLTWRKFAAILPITDELLEDSAIDLWNDATQRFARAYARKEDEMVFTRENGGGNLYPGIINVAGTEVITLDTGDESFLDLTADALNQMIYAVPTDSSANGRFYIHRELVGVIQRLKDSQDRYVWNPAITDGAPGTIWGKPYTVVEVLPGIADDDGGTPFAVFGDLRYAILGERTDLRMIVRDTGLVGDPDEEDQDTNTLNLFTQDMQAMRCVKRFNARVRFPQAFSVLKTAGTAGS